MSFQDLIKRSFPNATLVDEIESKLILNGFLSNKSLQTGMYLFVDDFKKPDIVIYGVNDKFHRVARAICLVKVGESLIGHIASFNISTLISSLSAKNGHKASLLYGIPNGNGLTWDDLKETYLINNVMNKLIILESNQANKVEWEFAKLKHLDAMVSKIELTKPLENYLEDRDLISILTDHLS